MSNNLIFNRISKNYEILKTILNNKERLLYSVHVLEKEYFLDAELSDEITKLVQKYHLKKIEDANKEIVKNLCGENNG